MRRKKSKNVKGAPRPPPPPPSPPFPLPCSPSHHTNKLTPNNTGSRYSEYKEAFALFDKRGTGAIPREVLGDLLRALGQNPTQAEVADIVANAPREGVLCPPSWTVGAALTL